jgi:hypothetical protein
VPARDSSRTRPGAKVSQGVLDAFWRLSMQAGMTAALAG